ncbi:MAG: hypothetical protein J6584_08960 [Lactobacillus sp.]|nr:hypothetical protein [Lactobacillus sp.]
MKRTHILGSILVAAGLAMSTSSYFQGQLAQAKTYNYKVATIKQEPYVLLNDDEGKTIVDRVLLAGTDWQVGKIADLNHKGLCITKYPLMNGSIVLPSKLILILKQENY